MPLQKQYYLTIPLKNREMSPVFTVVEQDVQGNKLFITLTHDGLPFDLTGASNITFTCLKADGNAVVDTATIEDAEAGKISCVLHQQCLTYPGIVRATIEVYSDNGATRITSTQFSFEVRAQLDDGSSIPSQEEYPILQQLIVDTEKVVNTEHKGEYDAETEYFKNNIVSYLGSSYMCIQDCSGQPPLINGILNSSYWELIANKGDKGAALTNRGEYSSLEIYQENDIVVYEGNVYYCKASCSNISPNNTSYWGLFIDDIARKAEVDAVQSNLITHLAETTQAHGGIVSTEQLNTIKSDIARIKDNLILNFFRDAIDEARSVQRLEDGIVDEFEDETGINTESSTGEIYNATYNYYSNIELLIEQTLYDTYSTHGDSNGYEYRAAQSFTLAAESTIIAVELFFGTSGGTPEGPVTLRIETLSSGLPSGTLANQNLTKANRKRKPG